VAVNKERQTTPRNVYQEKGSNSASAKHKHRCGVVLVHMFRQLLHYTAFHTYNTAMISTPLIHGINDRMVLMAEMDTVELQAQLDCQTGQGNIDHWSFRPVPSHRTLSAH